MNTKKKITGFSLLEIMIVVAIIGILGAVAMPSYTKFVKRAKATEVLALYSSIKIHMVEYHLETGKWPDNNGNLSLRNDAIDLGAINSYSTDTIGNAWVGSGGVSSKATEDSGHIAIIYKDGALHRNPNKKGGMFLATVERINGRYTWICNNTNATWKSTMNYDYLPESCHN